MKVVVCIGSSCHLKGSREVVEKLQNLINDNNLKDKVTLSGKFCMGNCQNGVSVTVDGELFPIPLRNSLKPTCLTNCHKNLASQGKRCIIWRGT